MSPGNEKAGSPGRVEPAPRQSVNQTNLEESTSEEGPTQEQRVLQLLLEREVVCGHHDLYGVEFMPRFGNAIYRLRRKGFVISKEQCDDVDHRHRSVAWTYRLIAIPIQPPDKPCFLCGGRLGHVSYCRARNFDPNAIPGLQEGPW